MLISIIVWITWQEWNAEVWEEACLSLKYYGFLTCECARKQDPTFSFALHRQSNSNALYMKQR